MKHCSSSNIRFVLGQGVTALLLAVLLNGCGGGGGGSNASPVSSDPPAPIPTPTPVPTPAPAPAPANPTVSIAANPGTVISGGTAMLSWSSTNATSCVASGSWSGNRPASGSEATPSITAGAAFTLTCIGAGGMAAATANVSVAPRPTVSITASPASVLSGGTTTLTWSSTDATSCVASGSWTGAKPTSGSQVITSITAASAYTLFCIGAGGMGAATASVSIAPTPTVTITANPTTLMSGGTTTLTWSSTEATSCRASGGWLGTRPTRGTESITSITAATAYTLTCLGPGGNGAATANVTIAQAPTPQPTVSITANPTTVMSAGTAILTWSSTNATSCVASGGWSGSRATSGSETTTPITAATSYTLACTGPGGNGAATANVAVAPRPTVSITANPATVMSGATTTLTWSSANATSCTASGSWMGARGTSGSEITAPITAGSAFTLTCTGAGGMGAATANVAVAPKPTVSITANPISVMSGGTTVLTWSSTNATSCIASGSWLGSKSTAGSEMRASIIAASAYTLTCTGLGGMGAATANVTIAPAPPPQPTVTITANPTTVSSGGTTTLLWSTTNSTACTASGEWSGPKATSGSEMRTAITVASRFTLMCTGAGGMGSATANVAVTAPAGSYQTEFSLTQNPISEGAVWSRARNTFTNVRTANGTAFGTNGPANAFDDSYALLRGFGPNQTAEAVIERSPNLNTNVTHEVELLLRFSDDAITARGYECLFALFGGVQIIRWDGGLNSGSMNFRDITVDRGVPRTPLKTGDVIKASIIGNAISVFINGTLVATATDSTYAMGQPGIGFFTRPQGNSANLAITSYKVTSN